MNVLDLLPKKSRGKTKVPSTRRSAAKGKPKASTSPAKPLQPIPLPVDLKRRLVALRRRAWGVAVGTVTAMLLGAASLLLLGQALADWWFDLPWLARAVFLVADGALLVTIYRRHFHPPRGARRSLASTALMVERKWPRLVQSVITAVELSEANPKATRGSRQLVDVVMEQARARTTTLNFKEVVPIAPLRRWAILGSVALLGTAAMAIVTWPGSLALAERIFLFNVPLPTKTLVVPISGDMTVPIGSDVELSARARGIVPSHGTVTVTYEEGQPQDFPTTTPSDTPDVFSMTLRNVQRPFKYRFHLNDGQGPRFNVTPKVPPAVTSLACTQSFPDYTKLPPQKIEPTKLSLLAGSHLKIEAVATEPLQSATVILRGSSQPIPMTLDGDRTHVTADVPIPAKNLTGFSLHLVDAAGVSSSNETVYPIDLVPDRLPAVNVTQPAGERETVTLQAKPLIAFDASDDYGLTQLTLVYECIPPPVGGFDAPALPIQKIPLKIKSPSEGTHYEYAFDVGAQRPPWQVGWTVNYWVEAVDNNTATGPGVTKTAHKQFGILTPGEKQAEILDRLKQAAANIDNLSDTQQKVSQDVGQAIPQK